MKNNLFKTWLLKLLYWFWLVIKYFFKYLFLVIKFIFTRAYKILKKYPELVVIPCMLLVWYYSMYIINYFDPQAGTFDDGIFQIIIFSAIQFSVYLSLAWFLLKVFNGTIRRFIQFDFKKIFKELDPWQKTKLSFCIFGFVILCYVLLSRVLFVTPIN